jgi:hypothetical protein
MKCAMVSAVKLMVSKENPKNGYGSEEGHMMSTSKKCRCTIVPESIAR